MDVPHCCRQLARKLSETEKLATASTAYKKDLLQQNLAKKDQEVQQANDRLRAADRQIKSEHDLNSRLRTFSSLLCLINFLLASVSCNIHQHRRSVLNQGLLIHLQAGFFPLNMLHSSSLSQAISGLLTPTLCLKRCGRHTFIEGVPILSVPAC